MQEQMQMELELLNAFRQLDFEFKEIVLLSIKGQAARCVARRPILRLVSSIAPVAVGEGLRTLSGGS